MSDKSFLDKWKKRIGEKEANRQTVRAGVRGTDLHGLCERYILNEEIDYRPIMPSTKDLFRQIKPVLDENVNDIMFSEGYLYSHKLKIAGAADLAAKWNGKNAIIDFKTSTKPKKKEWITNYFLQATLYSYMLWEMTGIYCPKIVIIIAVEEENKAQVFEDSIKNWMDEAFLVCKNYHKKMLTLEP